MKQTKKQKQSGFTLMELLVAMAITAFLTTVTLTSFNQGTASKATALASDTIITGIRTAQGASLNPKELTSGGCGDPNPSEYHVVFNTNFPTTFFVQTLDKCGALGPNLNSFNLPSRTTLKPGNSLSVTTAGVSSFGSSLNIKFLPPFGKMSASINGGPYNSFDSANIVVQSTNGNVTKNISLSGISGRVEVP